MSYTSIMCFRRVIWLSKGYFDSSWLLLLWIGFDLNFMQGKELHMHKCKKHPWLCPNSMINSIEFFLFTVVFLQPFALFLFFSFPPPFLWIPFRVIYYGFCTLFSIHVWVRCWEFFCPISPLLELSTLSYKAACLLFRHHLHINVARKLAGQHLMRR